ncbi:MAG: ABC transporter ATP-binding protein [Firmicutes bacterium]|nr:ABC transporter ATP-binding protein [Bacillota bacterium]
MNQMSSQEPVGATLSHAATEPPLIELNDLRTYFYTSDGIVRAVDGVSFSIGRHRALGLVGESGCGKSITALSIMGLVPQPPGKVTGRILFYREGGSSVALDSLPPKGPEYRSIRGKEIAMIFQEPMTSLNPVYTIGNQIMEAIMLHQGLDKKAARRRAIEMLDLVGIPNPERRVDEYPHQMSGGMRQRAMIAMALSCNPSLLIADEPTTALDVTIQAQILDLMRELQREFNASILMITHDLGVIAEMTSEVVVMYLGQVVEHGTVRDVFKKHLHPYTDGLLKSMPRIGSQAKQPLIPIQGNIPDPFDFPEGCRFEPRCPARMAECLEPPPLFQMPDGHEVRCWLYKESGVKVDA